MKKQVCIAVLMAAVVFGGMAFVGAEGDNSLDAAKGVKGMLIGDVIELSTYAMKGHGSEENAQTTKFRIEEGFPPAILNDEDGEIYVFVFRNNAPASHMEKANKHLVDLVGGKVVAQGLIYKQKGINVIRISLISEY